MSILQKIKNTLSTGGNGFTYKFNQGSVGGVVCNFEMTFNKRIEVNNQFASPIGAEGSYADYKLAEATIYEMSIVLGISTDKNISITTPEYFNIACQEIIDTLKPKIVNNVVEGQFIFSHPLYGTNIFCCLDGPIQVESNGFGGFIKFNLREILNDITAQNIIDFQRIQKSSANQKKNNIFDRITKKIQDGLTFANATTAEIVNTTSFFNTFANTLTSFASQLSSLQSNLVNSTQNYSNFLNAIQTFKGSIADFTTTPSLLAANLTEIYKQSSNVFSTGNASFTQTCLNDNIMSPFVNIIPKASTDQNEINRYHLLDISYKANLLCNFCVAMYDYKFSTLQELRTIFNRFYTLYQDFLGYRIFIYTNEYNDRICFDNLEPTNDIVEIVDLIKDLCTNVLAEFEVKKLTITQYKTFYAHIPYTLIGLHHLLYKKPYVESEGEDLIRLNELKDVTNIKGLIKYTVYD